MSDKRLNNIERILAAQAELGNTVKTLVKGKTPTQIKQEQTKDK